MGGIRAEISAGPITARDVFSVLPFGNELEVVHMSGAVLRQVVERKLAGEGGGILISGGEVVYDRDRSNYDKVISFRIGGEPLDYAKKYRVVVTSFLMEGNSGLDFLTEIPQEDVELTQITTAEAVEHYLAQHDPLRSRVDDRWLERRGGVQEPYLTGPYLP